MKAAIIFLIFLPHVLKIKKEYSINNTLTILNDDVCLYMLIKITTFLYHQNL